MDQMFTKNGIGIFFASRLDSRLSVESAHKFRFFAQWILPFRARRERFPKKFMQTFTCRANQSDVAKSKNPGDAAARRISHDLPRPHVRLRQMIDSSGEAMSAASRSRKRLDQELLALGDSAMLIEQLDGLIAGVLVCPELISPADWLPVVCGQDADGRSPFENIDRANFVFGLIMDY